jgi:organic hydroperoxide reductase OsmC/OhrA
MLLFQSFAARQGFTVASYTDQAVGVVTKGSDRREWISQVTFRPHVVFESDRRPAAADVAALHHAAHETCYIANSVRTEIAVEGRSDGLV